MDIVKTDYYSEHVNAANTIASTIKRAKDIFSAIKVLAVLDW